MPRELVEVVDEDGKDGAAHDASVTAASALTVLIMTACHSKT
jgi:hypothetical protein